MTLKAAIITLSLVLLGHPAQGMPLGATQSVVHGDLWGGGTYPHLDNSARVRPSLGQERATRKTPQTYRPDTKPSQVYRQGHTKPSTQGPQDRLGDPRPSKWCGWFARQRLGVADRSYNRARHWLHYGRPTPAVVGAVVVWPHHVGIIVGKDSNGRWLIESGNDGGRVKTRVWDLRGVLGYRI